MYGCERLSMVMNLISLVVHGSQFNNHYFNVALILEHVITTIIEVGTNLVFFGMYVSIVQVNLRTDHLWSTTWSAVITSTTTTIITNVFSLKNDVY